MPNQMEMKFCRNSKILLFHGIKSEFNQYWVSNQMKRIFSEMAILENFHPTEFQKLQKRAEKLCDGCGCLLGYRLLEYHLFIQFNVPNLEGFVSYKLYEMCN